MMMKNDFSQMLILMIVALGIYGGVLIWQYHLPKTEEVAIEIKQTSPLPERALPSETTAEKPAGKPAQKPAQKSVEEPSTPVVDQAQQFPTEIRKNASVECQSNPLPVFINHITDLEKVNYIVPPPTMGAGSNLKTHSYIGTDHALVPVYAPAAAILSRGSYNVDGPYTIELQVSCEVTIRFGHITNPVDTIKNLFPKEPRPDSRMQELEPISFAAGELIGYTTGTPQAGNWDFGVYHSATSNRYANDLDWNKSTTYTTAVCPFDYFTTELKSVYQAKFNPNALAGNPPHGESFCK